MKIGVFGGTFNPVHKGHVAVAGFFADALSLDRLYVIPTNVSPLKSAVSASAQDRIAMLRIAFADRPDITVSDMELRREGTSYTCDTVRELRAMHPKAKLYYLIGDDWISGFHRWKDYEYILDNVRLVIADRGGSGLTELLREFRRSTGIRPIVLKNPVVVAASSDFRVSHDGSMLPEGVYEYIKERNLYGI